MKKGILFCLLGMQFFCFAASQAPYPVNVNIYNTVNDQKNSTQPINNVISSVPNHFHTLLTDGIQSLQSAKGSLYDFIIAHWKVGILISIGTAYVSFILFLKYANKYLRNEQLWCHWRKALTMDELYCMNHDELLQLLLDDIHLKYFDVSCVSQPTTPAITFMRNIQKEEQFLTFLLTFNTTLARIYISKIPGCAGVDTAHVQELLKRIRFLKKIFITWHAKQNHNFSTAINRSHYQKLLSYTQ